MFEINETAPASPAALNAPSTELTLVAERLLKRPHRFQRLYKKHLDALYGPRRIDLMLEMSNLTQGRGEVAGFSASVLRRIIEGSKTEDYEEMGVDKVEVEAKLSLECLIPLSELDTGMDRRRGRSEERLENTWGEDWRVNLAALLPKWPYETFLRELAVFAEKNTFEEGKVFFPSQIKARIVRPRFRKSPWLTSRDLVKEGEEPTWVKRRITEVKDEEGSSTPSPIHPGRAVVSVTSAAPSVVSMTPEVLPLASPPPAAAPTLSRSSSPLVSPPPEPVVQRVRIKKKKAREKIEEAAKRTKRVKIPVINLDVYEKLKEMQEEAEKEGDDQKLRDITCVKNSLMWIGEADGEENTIELWERRMTLVHEALSLE